MTQRNRADLSGRTALITGATNGIGRAAAHALAGMGAELVLLARDAARGEQTAEAVRRSSGNERVSLLQCDLASLQQVRQAAHRFLDSGRPLHILLNNAGLVLTRREVSADGYEKTFAVNHLAHFLLTNLLLERMQASAPARIVNVSSQAHLRAGNRFDFDDPQAERRYSAFRVYGQSKLANLLFTRELARRLAGSAVTVNACHPGVVATGFGRNNRGLAWAFRLLAPLLRSPQQGADTPVYLCAAPEVAGVSGRYFADRRERTPGPAALHDEDARRLWELSERLTGWRASAA